VKKSAGNKFAQETISSGRAVSKEGSVASTKSQNYNSVGIKMKMPQTANMTITDHILGMQQNTTPRPISNHKQGRTAV
jgi:hypothetical protein